MMSYGLLKSALNASSLRQEAISSNIANINTPDYKANRVLFESYLKEAKNGVGLTHTNMGHMYSNNSSLPKITKQTNTFIQDNGNNVDIDFEMAELSANNIYYDSLVSQVNAKYNLMREAMK